MTDREWNTRYNRLRRERLEAEGKCVCCGKPNDRAAKGVKRCTRCSEAQKKSAMKLTEKRRAEHLCLHCGAPLDSTLYVNCEECRAKFRVWQKGGQWLGREETG